MQEISRWHSSSTANIDFTPDEILAGFDEIGERFDFQALIMQVCEFDLTKVNAIRAKYLHDFLETVQMRSWDIAAKRKYSKIKARK